MESRPHPRLQIFRTPRRRIAPRVEDARGRTILAIGDIFVANGQQSLDELLLRIAAGDDEQLDNLSGRFALAVLDGDNGRLLSDPLGSQAIFRTLEERPVFASHSSLIAECLDLEPSRHLQRFMKSAEYRARVTRFLPGDLSIYENVVHLIPNNELNLQDGTTRRYWPRSPTPAQSFDDVERIWDEYFHAYVEFLRPRYVPTIGLTGGLDSRAVIAAVRCMSLAAEYITWDKMPADEAARIPRLAEHLGSRHSWVRMDERPEGADVDEIRRAAKFATGLTRGTPLLPAQIAQVVSAGSLFLKGLGGEVMRGPYNSRLKKHLLSSDYEELAYALYAGNVRHDAGPEYEKVTREAIRGYLRRANYHANLHGADPGDLIYWEQRMGTWTAIQHAEFSVVLNSHSAMNSRKLFRAAWGLPDDERFGPGILLRLIEKYDPVFAGL